MNRLIASALAAGIQTAYQSRCDALVIERDGRVMGAVLSTLEGERYVRARRGVILTAGGFIYNDAMLARYAPGAAPLRLEGRDRDRRRARDPARARGGRRGDPDGRGRRQHGDLSAQSAARRDLRQCATGSAS